MVTRVHAACVLPMNAPPIAGGWLDVAGGTIVAMGKGRPTSAGDDGQAPHVLDLGHAVVLPGLVNAHTHLELSHLRGRVAPAASFVEWVQALLALRASEPAAPPEIITAAIDEAVASGTVALADIGNTRAAVAPLAAARVSAWHFDERLGFRAGNGEAVANEAWRAADAGSGAHGRRELRLGVAPHAPYSTAPGLIRAIVGALDVNDARRSSLHVAESPEESQLLKDGTGPWRAFLERLGVWDEGWAPPGTSTVRYLDDLGVLHRRLLVVHGTQCAPEDLDLLARRGCTLVLCARSNAWVGAGAPPVAEAFAAGVRVAAGTDSLASVDDLDMFQELAALRRLAPGVPAMTLLEAATHGGAEALGFDDLGALAPGRSSRALVVDLPADVRDVLGAADWLVSGQPSHARRRWLDECVARQEAA